jgi:integrase
LSLYKRKKSQIWWYEFEHAGKRIRRSSGRASKRAAAKVEEKARKQAEAEASIQRVVSSSTISLRIEDAALRYWEEKRASFSEGSNVHRDLMWLVDHFGISKLITDIDDGDVANLVNKRRKDRVPHKDRTISAQTVNHTVVRLQAVFRHAKEKWKVKFPNEPIWREHKLEVQRKPARVFEGDEKARFDGATRDDYRPVLDFSYESAKRRSYCVGLRWPEVNWARGVIERPGKRKPNGEIKMETVEITPEIRAILEPLKGHHPEFVFTYVAQRTRDGRKRGQRYPIVTSNIKTRFTRICAKADIDSFGFHSMRRSAATEFYDANDKDLLLTQRFLAHGDSKTTERYIRRDDRNVKAGMENRSKKRTQTEVVQEVPTPGPHTDAEEAA